MISGQPMEMYRSKIQAILATGKPLEEVLFLLVDSNAFVQIGAPSETNHDLGLFVYAASRRDECTPEALVGFHFYPQSEIRRTYKWLSLNEQPIQFADDDVNCLDPEWHAKRNKKYRIKWDYYENRSNPDYEPRPIQVGSIPAFIPLVLMYAYASAGMVDVYKSGIILCEKFMGLTISLDLVLVGSSEENPGWHEKVLIPFEPLETKYL